MAQSKDKNNSQLRAMPKSPDAEAALLSCFMLSSEAVNEFIPDLNERDFYTEENRLIFLAVRSLAFAAKSVDVLTVYDKLQMPDEKGGRIGQNVSMEYLTGIANTLPSAANAKHYFDIVKRDSLLRDIINAGNKIVDAGFNSESGQDALNKAESYVFSISENADKSALEPISVAATQTYNLIKSIQTGEHIDNGIKTGFLGLDNILESLKPGALYILAARPSVGKTAFALSLAIQASIKQGKSTAIFSLEMPATQLAQRMMTSLSGASFKRQARRNGLTLIESSNLFQAHTALMNAKIFVDDNSNNHPSDIISKCRRLKNTDGKGLDLVIIDYLQLMSMTGEDKPENRQQEVSTMSRLLKIYSKELNVPIVVLSQLSRGVEMRGDEPKLSDLRESGSIEQDADVVMFLHRVKVDEKNKNEDDRALAAYDGMAIKLLVEKNRSGERGVVYLEFRGDTQTFVPIEKDKLNGAGDEPQTKPNGQSASLPKQTDDDAFAGLKPVGEVATTVEVVGEDSAIKETVSVRSPYPQPIKEPVFDSSNAQILQTVNNESGDQSRGEVSPAQNAEQFQGGENPYHKQADSVNYDGSQGDNLQTTTNESGYQEVDDPDDGNIPF